MLTQASTTLLSAFADEPKVKSAHRTVGKEAKDTPVYLYRSLFAEMSQLGSNLIVEPFDEDDY